MGKKVSKRSAAKDRAPLLDATQSAVLTKSRRRCCLCYWLNGIDEVKKGQIAHLDQDRSIADEDDLVFLCHDHHDEYDSIPSQSKGLREKEVRHWRDELYREMTYLFREYRLPGDRRKDTFEYLEKAMPDFLTRLRADLKHKPLARLISLSARNVHHDSPWQLLIYHFEEMPQLREKVMIMTNSGLLKPESADGTFYWITEELAGYLRT